MGRRGFVEDKVLVGLEAGTIARINRVLPKRMSRGAFIRQAIENEIGLYEAACRFYDEARIRRLEDSKRPALPGNPFNKARGL